MNMGIEQFKYFVFKQSTDNSEDAETIIDESNGIGYWVIIQAEFLQEAWDYLRRLGRGIDRYDGFEAVEVCECCGAKSVEHQTRWGQFCQYKQLDLQDGVEFERLALMYEPDSLDRIINGFQSIKGFIHKINGDFSPFYSDINFFDCGL